MNEEEKRLEVVRFNNEHLYCNKEDVDFLLGLLDEEKKKNKEAVEMLERHINHCEGEAAGSMNNEVCHIALKFDKHLLQVLKGETNE